jgi:hypothetical protein
MTENLPEGTLRSSPLPLGQRGGTRLFLSFENGWYRVHTRFENFFKRRDLRQAIDIYESILSGELELP